MVLSQRKLSFSKDPEGVQHFPGGPTFSRGGGPNANFYRNPYNLCFSFPGEECSEMFVCFDSLHPINNLSDIKGRVFLG